MNFAQIAKDLREETGLSQQRLGEKLGISSSGIGHLEVGDCEPKSSTLIAYAKYFDVTIEYLLGLEDNFGTPTTAPMSDGLSSEERDILNKYRALPPKLQKLVRDNIEIYSESNELLPKKGKKV